MDINQIMAFGVMMTPALAVDGDVKVVGKVPTLDGIKSLVIRTDAGLVCIPCGEKN